MDLGQAKTRYLTAGQFYDPEYGCDNETLASFRTAHPTLTSAHTRELIEILRNSDNDWDSRIFVADLLYYYDTADDSLLQPMLRAAIEFPDPSFNRVFLRPCLTLFGTERVVASLVESFATGTLHDRLGVSLLLYWLRAYQADVALIDTVIEDAALKTDNQIELYYYKLALPHRPELFPGVPDHAKELERRIRGNAEYEHLLYSELRWRRPESQAD